MTVDMQVKKHLTPEGTLAKISSAPCVNLMPQGPLASCDCSVVVHHIQFPSQLLVWFQASQGWWITHTSETEALTFSSSQSNYHRAPGPDWIDLVSVTAPSLYLFFCLQPARAITTTFTNKRKKAERKHKDLSETKCQTPVWELHSADYGCTEKIRSEKKPKKKTFSWLCVRLHLLLRGSYKTLQNPCFPYLHMMLLRGKHNHFKHDQRINWAITEQTREWEPLLG